MFCTAALLIGLGACHPVDTWRELTGVNKNDPDPATTPNSKNLAAGEAKPYPNLASVPPPPSTAMTTAEREKLAQSLIADRANARYSSEQLQPGFAPRADQPPPPATPGAARAFDKAAAAAASSTPPAPEPAAPAITAAPSPPPPSRLARRETVPVRGEKLSSLPEAATAEPSAPPETDARQPSRSGSRSGPPPSGRRKAGEPAEPGPQESTLQSPQIPSQPQPEQPQPQPPPPPPKLPAGMMAGGALMPMTPPPAAVASATPQAPPPAPNIAPAAAPPPPAETAPAAGKAPAKPGAAVASINFTGDSAAIGANDQPALAKVASQYHATPGTVHVVVYAAAADAASGADQLGSYRLALDRAQAIATALVKAGVPVGKVQSEAAPAKPGIPAGHAVMRIDH